MHMLLAVLGWVVVGLATCRAIAVAREGLGVRALMVASWVLLAAGVAVSATWHLPDTTRWLWAAGLIIGTGAFAVRAFVHGRGD